MSLVNTFKICTGTIEASNMRRKRCQFLPQQLADHENTAASCALSVRQVRAKWKYRWTATLPLFTTSGSEWLLPWRDEECNTACYFTWMKLGLSLWTRAEGCTEEDIWTQEGRGDKGVETAYGEALWSVLLTNHYSGDRTKKNELVGHVACMCEGWGAYRIW
jgi:hypothetical protein